ncbi:hypothetical protein D3C73_1281780 [compost metagenome]
MLHQPFGVAQQVESLGVIQAIGRQLGQPEKTIQRSFVLATQANLQAGLEVHGRLLFPTQAQVQSAPTQGDPSQQGFGIRVLPTEQAVHVGEQVIGPAGRSALLEQLRVIKLQQPFEYQ